jgi:hypothetical protein
MDNPFHHQPDLTYGTVNTDPKKENKCSVIRVSQKAKKLWQSSNVHSAMWGCVSIFASVSAT